MVPNLQPEVRQVTEAAIGPTHTVTRSERGCGSCYAEDLSSFSAPIENTCSGSDLFHMAMSDPARIFGIVALLALFATGMYKLYKNLARRHTHSGYEPLPTNVQVFETEVCAVL